ncbi:hypothetical protein AGDE_07430 [Angomonas deanei]|uniref:Dynein heavy chain coiled coil stalk domain-containing protein n=1 Tax=Angomonas deanei TaxID=59799 RepID=A0A7G2CMW9_9TRYP|nr:hypothetical protein AGDE_07430 [Angomonas deanei]CAD2220294.1 hypothetical protein, conserved [Angomonas deanei]|eukprot:EPY35354.1 hypothetical protein AGDE_07430 [Angomonas deanei]
MLAKKLDPPTKGLSTGQIVAFDHIVKGSNEWQWTLGTLGKLDENSAVVDLWGIHQGSVDTLKSILSREVDNEMQKMKNYQNLLLAAREKLASIRSSNEDDVSRVRCRFDDCRDALGGFDEVDYREILSQGSPSPVAMASLKAALAIVKCDPSIDEYYKWDDVQVEYRKMNALSGILKADVVSKIYPSVESMKRTFTDPRLSLEAARKDSDTVAAIYAWVVSALEYQEAYTKVTNDSRIQEQNDAIASAIAGMKACRDRVTKLKEELNAKNPAALPGQVTSFTKTSVKMTIPLSAIISVTHVERGVTDCALTDNEVKSILVDAKKLRFQYKDKLRQLGDSFVESEAELRTLQVYSSELEERFYFLEHYFTSALRDEQGINEKLAEEMHALNADVDDLKRDLEDLMSKLEDQEGQLAEKDLELAAYRKKRAEAKNVRSNDPELREVDKKNEGNARAARGHPDPKEILSEPLLSVTMDEYAAKRNDFQDASGELEKALEELARATEECEKLNKELEEKDKELGAFREKRFDAKSVRLADPELSAADRQNGLNDNLPRSSRQAVRQAADPQILAKEPLLSVTFDELEAARSKLAGAEKELEDLARDIENLEEELDGEKNKNREMEQEKGKVE